MSPDCDSSFARARRFALAAVAALLVGCAGPQLTPWRPTPGPNDRLSPGQVERLAVARALVDQRDALGAVRVYEAALDRDDLHVGIARALQEARLAALERGEQWSDFEAWVAADPERGVGPPATLLWRWYDHRARAAEAGGANAVVERLMAARLDPDDPASLRQLDELLEQNSDCIWVHLGRASTLLRMGRLGEARSALDRALELDLGHAPTRRLEALLLAREGEGEAYVLALERWLDETADDPLVTAAERDRASLDLAAAYLDRGRFRAARDRLDELIESPQFDELASEPRYEAFLLRAAAREGRSDFRGALDDAERARVEAPARVEPWVQIAILQQHRLGDPQAADAAWAQVEALAAQVPADERLPAFLQALRARVERANAVVDGVQP